MSKKKYQIAIYAFVVLLLILSFVFVPRGSSVVKRYKDNSDQNINGSGLLSEQTIQVFRLPKTEDVSIYWRGLPFKWSPELIGKNIKDGFISNNSNESKKLLDKQVITALVNGLIGFAAGILILNVLLIIRRPKR